MRDDRTPASRIGRDEIDQDLGHAHESKERPVARRVGDGTLRDLRVDARHAGATALAERGSETLAGGSQQTVDAAEVIVDRPHRDARTGGQRPRLNRVQPTAVDQAERRFDELRPECVVFNRHDLKTILADS